MWPSVTIGFIPIVRVLMIPFDCTKDSTLDGYTWDQSRDSGFTSGDGSTRMCYEGYPDLNPHTNPNPDPKNVA